MALLLQLQCARKPQEDPKHKLRREALEAEEKIKEEV